MSPSQEASTSLATGSQHACFGQGMGKSPRKGPFLDDPWGVRPGPGKQGVEGAGEKLLPELFQERATA